MSASVITVVPVAYQHKDGRRAIFEATAELSLLPCCRVTFIDVSDTATEPLRLGDHYHPGDETFVFFTGWAWLYTAPADDPTNVSVRRIGTKDAVNIPPNTIHTFVCAPGTQFQHIANVPFDPEHPEKWTVLVKLDLDLAVAV